MTWRGTTWRRQHATSATCRKCPLARGWNGWPRPGTGSEREQPVSGFTRSGAASCREWEGNYVSGAVGPGAGNKKIQLRAESVLSRWAQQSSLREEREEEEEQGRPGTA